MTLRELPQITNLVPQALKRLERLLKELELQAMEDTQTIERQVEQIANVNSRNKQLKTQFADAVSVKCLTFIRRISRT